MIALLMHRSMQFRIRPSESGCTRLASVQRDHHGPHLNVDLLRYGLYNTTSLSKIK